MVKLAPVMAGLLLLLLLAGCGEKEDTLEPAGSKRVELMLDYFPNADHAGIYAAQAGGRLRAGGARRRDPPAARSGCADQAGGRGPGGPGDLVRARGAASA